MGSRKFKKEFIRFLLVGAINTALSFLVYLFLLKFLTYLLAYSISYCIGVAISYFLNVYVVFKKRATITGFISFPVVYIIQYCLGATTLWLLVDGAEISPVIAMMVVIIVTIPVTFLTSRFVLNR